MSTLTLGPKEKYRSLLNNHIKPVFGAIPLGDVSSGIVQDFINDKREEGLSWWTLNDLKGIVSGIYTKATEWGYLSGQNPTKGVELGPKQYKRTKYRLSDEQIVTLLNELKGDLQLMVATILSTGLRITELCGCRAGNVERNGAAMAVVGKFYRGEGGDTKTPGSHRVVCARHVGRGVPQASLRVEPR